jgi:hypothetical protein
LADASCAADDDRITDFRLAVDVTVGLTAGSRLLLLWGAANRDPSHFYDPDQFRLDRLDGKGHIAFGRGAHFCVGAALARLEARIVLGSLLDGTSTIEAAHIGGNGCPACWYGASRVSTSPVVHAADSSWCTPPLDG